MPATDQLLLGTFFTVDDLQAEPGRLRAQLHLNPQHPIFQGHFPQKPVVPGVCVLTMSKDVLQQHLGRPLLLRSCASVKFLHPIDPTLLSVLTLTLDYTAPDAYALDFQLGLQHQAQPLCRATGRFQTSFL